jgi:MFS family permease
MRIVVAWSVCTAATGYAWSAASLIVTRFLFGAGEAGCFPNLTKAFMLWLPGHERARAQAIMWLSARWAGAFTPLAVIWVMTWLSWRNAFVLFGALGVVWAVWFFRWFRDRPAEHPGVNAAELALIGSAPPDAAGAAGVPWATWLRSRAVWLLWAQYVSLNYGWFFYVTWLPTYLRDRFGVDVRANPLLGWFDAALSGIVYFLGGLCWCWLDPVTPLDRPATAKP